MKKFEISLFIKKETNHIGTQLLQYLLMLCLNLKTVTVLLFWLKIIWAQQIVDQEQQQQQQQQVEVKADELPIEDEQPQVKTIYKDSDGNIIENPSTFPESYDALVHNDDLITRLTAENFASFINGNDLVLLEFTIPKCPHSKMILPEIWQAAANLKPHDIKVGQINCEVDEYICSELKISYYPTFKIFKNKKMVHSNKVEYDRSSRGLTDYMLTQIGNSVRDVSNDQELNEILTENPDQSVVVEKGIPDLNNTFATLANELFQSHIFVSYHNQSEIETASNTTMPVIEKELLLYQPFNVTNDETRLDPLSFQGNFTELVDGTSTLNSWLKYAPLPNYAEVDPSSFKQYIESQLPLGHFFYINQTEFNETKPFFEELGAKYKGKMNFIALNARIYFKQVKYLNLLHQFPVFGILDITNNLKYGTKQMPMDDYLKLTEFPHLNITEVNELVEKFINGTAEPNIKTEDIPEVQEGRVTKLVALTHDDFINNNEKDILVRYYAEWDMHSKKTTEMFHELGEFFSTTNDYNEKISFAEIDASANDLINVNINSYPTFVLYPAGFNVENDSGIILVGPKNPKYIINLIRNNGTFGIDAREDYLQLHPDERENFYNDVDLTNLNNNKEDEAADAVIPVENDLNVEEQPLVPQDVITEDKQEIVQEANHDEL